MSRTSAPSLRVGLSGDFRTSDGSHAFDPQAWQWLHDAFGVAVEFLSQPAGAPIRREDAARFDALIIKRNRVGAAVLEPWSNDAEPMRLRLLARNGVGYDHIDIDACNRAGVMVCITSDAVARPVASSILALILAFAHRLFERDRLTREGQWARRWDHRGTGLTGRVLGVVGLGNIGRELLRLVAPWGMRHMAYAPRPRPARYQGLDVELVSLETLFQQSDIVALCCSLNASTHRMIDARLLAFMQPHAILINTARGEIVDEEALIDALRAQRIAGAGIDVFAQEPPTRDHPLFVLPNVILGSHNLAHTDELDTAANRAVARAVLSMAEGEVPQGSINPEVMSHPRWGGAGAKSDRAT